MSGPLLHSMSEFSDIILGALTIADAREIVEIGAEYGGMSTLLAEHAGALGGRLTSIDPAPKAEFLQWAKERDDARHLALPSLQAFEHLHKVDAWLVDGDHNWFTVYHELKNIEAACRRDDKPMLAFLHDIAWPAGRRDMYYAPDAIPEAFRQAYDYVGGAFPGQVGLVANRGFRGMGQFAFAATEGGARNGVATAVEDFLEEVREAGRVVAYAEIPCVFGLGILFDTDAQWSDQLAQFVLPYHENRLLRALEDNRLRNYLAVLEWQDRSQAL